MKFPSFFKLQKNNHVLFWNGIEHSCDYKHSQFQKLKIKWGEFLKLAKSPLVIVENNNSKVYPTEERAVKDGCEVGFMIFLAAKIAVPVKCFEPNRHNEMNYLAGLFSKEKTEYYYFARAVAQWYRVVKNGKVEEYVFSFLKRDEKVSKWDNFDFSIDHMRQIHKNLFGNELDFNDKEFFLKVESPVDESNPLKDVVRASSVYRDISIIESVKSVWKENDIFMVYGRGHQEAHEKGLYN